MFWFILAAHLGMSVARCQQEVDAAEFNLWYDLYRREPFGELREDMRAARQLQATLAPYVKRLPSFQECLLFPPPKREAGSKQLMTMLMEYTKAIGGEIR